MRQERRLSFGSKADLYDRMRPSYPAELVDDVIAYAGIDGSGSALEVGSGTGKATVLFAQRGLRVHGVEPSAQMAAIARRATAAYGDGVEIEECDFEHFEPGDRRFRLVFSAQAWHWVAPEVRYVKALVVLEPGGALAVFWTRPRWERSPHRAAVLEAYRRAAPDFDAVGRPGPMNPANTGPSKLWGDWPHELREAPGFEDPETRAYDWSIRYSAGSYVELLSTHSDHALLAEEERRRLFEEIRAQIEALGGELEVAYVTDLYLARAA